MIDYNQMRRKHNALFFDVDTQNDFINPNGALYVHDAEKLKDKFRQLIEYARSNSIPICGSVDAHLPDDPELIRNNGPFPDHCMLGEKGQKKVNETKPLNPKWVPNLPLSKTEIETVLTHKGEVYFQKQSFDVFDNPAIKRCIKGFNLVIVFGVATDYCISAAVKGFLKLNKKVFLVTDAIKPVNINPGDGKKALEEMQKCGVHFTTTLKIIHSKNI